MSHPLKKRLINTTLCASFLLGTLETTNIAQAKTVTRAPMNKKVSITPLNPNLMQSLVKPASMATAAPTMPVEANSTNLDRIVNHLQMAQPHALSTHALKPRQLKPRDATDTTVDPTTINFSGTYQGVSYTCTKGVLTINGEGKTISNPVSIGTWNSDAKYVTKIIINGSLYLSGNCNSFFSDLKNLITIENLDKLDTSQVTNMSDMFGCCFKLTSLDVSKFNTSNVTNMYRMFGSCNNLTNLDLSHFDTSKVTDIGSMFGCCFKLTSLDVSKFNTSNVTNMDYMFIGCSSLTSLDISNFDTSKVNDMQFMFEDCHSLISLDVSKFNTSNVTNMDYMFSGCSRLANLDLSKFDTSKVTHMQYMFEYCSNLTKLALGPKVKLNSNIWFPIPDKDTYWVDRNSSSDAMLNGNKRWTNTDFENFDGTKDAGTYIRVKTYPIKINYHDGASVTTDTITMPNTTAGFIPGQKVDYQAKFTSHVNDEASKNYKYNTKKSNVPFNNYDKGDYNLTLPTNYTGQSFDAYFADVTNHINVNYVDLDDNNKILQTKQLDDRDAKDHLVSLIDYKAQIATYKTAGYTHDYADDKIPSELRPTLHYDDGSVDVDISHLDDNSTNNYLAIASDVTNKTFTVQIGLRHKKAPLDANTNLPDSTEKPELTKIVKRTFKYTGLPDNKLPQDSQTQTATFTRTGTYDYVTKQPIYSN